MESHSAFVEAFFKWELIERYFPAIMKGVGVTVEIAAPPPDIVMGIRKALGLE